MLPENLIELFEGSTAGSLRPNTRRASIAALVHANQVQAMVHRTAAAQFAHAHSLNLIDFHVVQTVVSLHDADTTATPGYISRQLSLSASTLTSILERLVTAGYLVRERDSADRRRISIYYTQKAADLVVGFYTYLAGAYEAQLGDVDDAGLEKRAAELTALSGAGESLAATFDAADAEAIRRGAADGRQAS